MDGNWGPWGGWSGCSLICNTGSMTRTRSCNNPVNGGLRICPTNGPSVDSQICNTNACPCKKYESLIIMKKYFSVEMLLTCFEKRPNLLGNFCSKTHRPQGQTFFLEDEMLFSTLMESRGGVSRLFCSNLKIIFNQKPLFYLIIIYAEQTKF